MDNEKIAELKGWLREAKHKECEKYMAIAINDKHHMVAAVDSDRQSMFEMLAEFAAQNKAFKEVVMMVAAFFIEKDNKDKAKEGENHEQQ